MHRKFSKRVFTNANFSAIIKPTRRTKGEKPMAEEYREPMIKKEDGFCFLQNGTYKELSGSEIWEEHIKPMLTISMDNNPKSKSEIKPSEKCTFYELLVLGSEDVVEMIQEVKALAQQSAKMKTQILKKGGIITVPDAEYFTNLYNNFQKEFSATNFYGRAELTYKFAFSLAKEYRNCMRKCIAHNYTTAMAINDTISDPSAKIPIPEVAIKSMQKITDRVQQEETDKRKPDGRNKK